MHNTKGRKASVKSGLSFKKKCRLCGVEFITSREWQKFCCNEHRAEYWGEIQRDRYALNRRIEELEKKLGIQ